MFSFIKFLQAFLGRLKKNKGLWFTTLTILSALGILVSMTVINVMTKNVAHKTFLEERKLDSSLLDGYLASRYDSLLTIGGILSIHPQIIANINDDAEKTQNDMLTYAKKTINNKINIDPIDIHYYDKTLKVKNSENFSFADLAMESQQNVSGIVVNKQGVRIIGITPVIDKNVSIGAIEVSQSIHALKNDFERMGKEFVFLLNKNQLVFLDLEHKTDEYQDIDDTYKVAFHNYDSKFYINVQHINMEDIFVTKYVNDANYYTTYNEATDLNGNQIGLFFIGEDANNANSFVKITENMIKSVTTVALGLVISLILFMF